MAKNLSLIVAFDANGLIGKANHLPWSVKEDLQYFKSTTMGHPVVMGRKTWLSIGKPLDGRINIILTTDPGFAIPGCLIMHSVDEVLSSFPEEEVFIIGGAQVFASFLPYVNKLYTTRINHVFEGETYFPPINWSEWKLIFFEQKTSSEGYEISFEQWNRQLLK